MIVPCPNCQSDSKIGVIAKLSWGSAFTKECENCGAELSISWVWSALLSVLAIPLTVILLRDFDAKGMSILALLLVVIGLIQIFLVPVEMSKNQKPQK